VVAVTAPDAVLDEIEDENFAFEVAHLMGRTAALAALVGPTVERRWLHEEVLAFRRDLEELRETT
jgi:hypothetical protein